MAQKGRRQPQEMKGVGAVNNECRQQQLQVTRQYSRVLMGGQLVHEHPAESSRSDLKYPRHSPVPVIRTGKLASRLASRITFMNVTDPPGRQKAIWASVSIGGCAILSWNV